MEFNVCGTELKSCTKGLGVGIVLHIYSGCVSILSSIFGIIMC